VYYSPKRKRQLLIVNAIFVLLFLVVIALLQQLGRAYSIRFDLTDTGRHSLSPASVAAVERLKGKLTITAYASLRGGVRTRIQEIVNLYRRNKSDIELSFVDSDESPDLLREAGIRDDGELILEHDGAKERLGGRIAPLDEENFTHALLRLGQRRENWIVFMAGHRERSPDNDGNADLSIWAEELRKRGFKTRVHPLAQHGQIPANTSVFVIAGPRSQLLPNEAAAIQKYVDAGGNILWLHDPGPLHGLSPVAESVGIEFLPGVLVDGRSQTQSGRADAIVVSSYGSHPVVRGFQDVVTVFPEAGALGATPLKGWDSQIVVDTSESAWLETGAVRGTITFDKGKDLRGPLALSVALSRTREKTDQRVVVVADGDFVSNTFIAKGSNLDLGLSMVNWLAHNDSYVSIPVRAAKDRQFEMSPNLMLVLITAYFGLPLIAAGAGITVWWRRRKR
jgi:ABC-type uncharacterized transport system involved in gliding motility auxiliary subunit